MEEVRSGCESGNGGEGKLGVVLGYSVESTRGKMLQQLRVSLLRSLDSGVSSHLTPRTPLRH